MLGEVLRAVTSPQETLLSVCCDSGTTSGGNWCNEREIRVAGWGRGFGFSWKGLGRPF